MTKPVEISTIHRELILSIIEKLHIGCEYQVTSSGNFVCIKEQCINCDLVYNLYISDSEFIITTYGVCCWHGDRMIPPVYSDHTTISLSDPELIAKLQEYLNHTYEAGVRTYGGCEDRYSERK